MQLKENYKKIRTATIAFCNHLEIEDFAIQVAKFASPAKWHLAHTTWFFETFILKEIDKNYLEFDANFNYLFNSYYNNVGSRVLQNNRGNMSRPSTNTIFEYRKHVDAKIINARDANTSNLTNTELT